MARREQMTMVNMDDAELISLLESGLTRRLPQSSTPRMPSGIASMLEQDVLVPQEDRVAVEYAIRDHEVLAPMLGSYLNVSSDAPQLNAESLAQWLFTAAAKAGAARAVADLRALALAEGCEVEEYFAFSGIHIEARIEVGDRLDLVPISQIPESVGLRSLRDPGWDFGVQSDNRDPFAFHHRMGMPGGGYFHSNPGIATAAFRRREFRRPALVRQRRAYAPAPDPWIPLIGVLAAHAVTPMFPVGLWISAAPPLPHWDRFGWGRWHHAQFMWQLYEVAKAREQVAGRIERFQSADEKFQRQLAIPLDRFNRALAAKSPVDRAIEMGIALEALLLGDLGPNEQISLAFRLRGAWLLGVHAKDRERLLRRFKYFYQCRSSAVHTGKLPERGVTGDSGAATADEFLTGEASKLTAQCITTILDRASFPDWSSLLVGGAPRPASG
jgi:hypothetical protein